LSPTEPYGNLDQRMLTQPMRRGHTGQQRPPPAQLPAGEETSEENCQKVLLVCRVWLYLSISQKAVINYIKL
jgi:hypothetical protein